MNADSKTLKKRLKEAGLSNPLIEAAWPAWWSEEALSSQSAKAELRFTIARKLGLNPKALFHDEVEFVWKDEARFKHLSNETDGQKAALTSFGISVCRMLVRTLTAEPAAVSVEALELRMSILQRRTFIDLQGLLAACWAIGVPVIHLRVFPLDAKRMHAMAVKAAGRHAILLGRDADYPAPVAFTLAHEIGHIMLGHIAASSAIIDVGDPLGPNQGDIEEEEADRYALELLLGTPRPDIQTNVKRFNSAQLAQAVLDQGPTQRIEPGTLALCLAYEYDLWPVANAAMQHIYTEQKPVWQEVNGIALRELDFAAVSDDHSDYLRNIMGIGHG
jgi:Zn-dependent peptidase ImmA (M78 family)